MIAEDLQVHADVLWEAESARVAIRPLTESDPSLTTADAYMIQTINYERKLAGGGRLLGRKVGLTSKPMQEMLGVDEPDFGVLMDDMFVEEGDDVDLGRLMQPRVEAEIAFLLEHDLAGPGVTTTGASRSVAGVVPALEVIDSRIADWNITLPDTVADNASSGRVVLGGRVTPLDRLDLRLLGMAISRNGELVDTGAGAAVLGNPLRCLAWLANELSRYGDGLHAGDVVLAGALHRAAPIEDGDVFRAAFAHLGTVTTRFVDSGAAA